MLLLERLLEIYDKKQWIQQMVIEYILLLIKSCDPSFMMPIVSRVINRIYSKQYATSFKPSKFIQSIQNYF